jgi:hypothetical protein
MGITEEGPAKDNGAEENYSSNVVSLSTAQLLYYQSDQQQQEVSSTIAFGLS